MFKIPLQIFWRHPETGTHLEILSITWRDTDPEINLELHSLRPTQPGQWILSINSYSSEASTLLKDLLDYRVSLYLKQSHPLTRHLLNKLITFLEGYSRSKSSPSLKSICVNYQ